MPPLGKPGKNLVTALYIVRAAPPDALCMTGAVHSSMLLSENRHPPADQVRGQAFPENAPGDTEPPVAAHRRADDRAGVPQITPLDTGIALPHPTAGALGATRG
jgi:hypothetical protein